MKRIPTLQVHLLDPSGRPAPFRLAFYGVMKLELTIEMIDAALRRRGLEPASYTVNHALTRRTY